MNEILKFSATRQALEVKENRISSVELVREHLRNAGIEDPAAEARARETDEALARGGKDAPLGGVPYALPTALKDTMVADRLRRAGAVAIAQPSIAAAAALVDKCGAPLALGIDAAGSLRLAAAYHGLAALKPSPGRIPRTGSAAPPTGWIESLWQFGPLVRRTEDFRTLMAILSGVDGNDPTAVDILCPDPWEVNLPSLRVACFRDDPFAPVDRETQVLVRAAADALLDVVPTVDDIHPGDLAHVWELHARLMGADGGKLAEPLLPGWGKTLAPQRTDLNGLAERWAEWDRVRIQMLSLLRQTDVIIGPAFPTVDIPDPAAPPPADLHPLVYTTVFNLCGWAAAVVRCGASASGKPIAIQVIAPPWREDIAMAVASLLEDWYGGWKAPAA